MRISKVFHYLLCLAVLAFSVSSSAQTSLKVSTGGSSGTYSRMFKELQASCKDEISQVETNSTGSVQNVDRILANEVNAIWVQTDVLFYRQNTEDLSSLKTLITLYPEEVHVIARSESLIKTGGTLGFGAKPININKVEDLSGLKVAAWGGGLVTANVIRLQTEIGFYVVEYQGFKEAKAALDSGAVAAIVMVGGYPMSDVTALDRNYKLVSFSANSVGKLKSVYVPAKITYSGMGQGGSGIETIATEALFVTYAYKTPKYVESLASLRSCFNNILPHLAEATGAHAKWKKVQADNRGKWAYYELPNTTKSSAQPKKSK